MTLDLQQLFVAQPRAFFPVSAFKMISTDYLELFGQAFDFEVVTLVLFNSYR